MHCSPGLSCIDHVTDHVLIMFPDGSVDKNSPAIQKTQERGVRSLGWEDPLEEEKAIHSTILAWEIQGQRSLVGYSPWGRKESDTTEHTAQTVSYCFI